MAVCAPSRPPDGARLTRSAATAGRLISLIGTLFCRLKVLISYTASQRCRPELCHRQASTWFAYHRR